MSLIRFELRKLKENKLLLGIVSFTILFVVFLFSLNRFMQIQVREEISRDLDQRIQSISWEINGLVTGLEEGQYVGREEEIEERLDRARDVHSALNQTNEAFRTNNNEEYLTMRRVYQENAYAYQEIGGSISIPDREFSENEWLFSELLEDGFHYEDTTFATNPVHFFVIALSWFFHPIGLSLFVILIGIIFSSEYDNHTVRFMLIENNSRKKWLGVSSILHFCLFLSIFVLVVVLSLGISYLWGQSLIGDHMNGWNVPIDVFVENNIIVTAQEKIIQLMVLGIPLFLLLFSIYYHAIILMKQSIKGLLLYGLTIGSLFGLTETLSFLKHPMNPFSYFDHQWVSSQGSISFVLTGIAITLLFGAIMYGISLYKLSKKPV